MGSKQKNLVINADDYGLTKGVNSAILELLYARRITSTSVMAARLDHIAATQLREVRKELGVSLGMHVTLTELPALSGVSSLTDQTGNLPKREQLDRLAIYNRLRIVDLVREIGAQAQRLRELGIHPVHLDTHQNVGAIPQVFFSLLLFARRNGVRIMRNNRRLYADAYGKSLLKLTSYNVIKEGIKSGYSAVGRLAGIRYAGRILELKVPGWKADLDAWHRLARLCPEGTFEVFVHPAYVDDQLAQSTKYVEARAQEFHALMDERLHKAWTTNGVNLIPHGNIR